MISGGTGKLTITVDQSTGALTISEGNCTKIGPETGNPSSNWNKTTYRYSGGTININVTDNTKNFNTAITTEKNGVEELYHYINGNNHVLKLKKEKKYYIYYMKSSDNDWKKYNNKTNFSDAHTDVMDVINNHLSNRVEIQLEINTTSAPYIQFDHNPSKNVTVEGAQNDITGYKGYKHTIAGGLKIEKISHNGNLITGQWRTPISNVKEVHVYYDENDSERDNPLLLYTKIGTGTTTYTYYGRGMKDGQMHWRGLRPGETSELNATVLQPHLDKMSR